MIKSLRLKHNWSQEHLATISGVSLRTIQRIEAGNKASMETLKSLAAVFDVEVASLTAKMTVLEKESDAWKAVPVWVRAGLWGVRKRNIAIRCELIALGVGLTGLALSFISPGSSMLMAFLGAAYWMAASIRWVDNALMWE